MYWKEIKIHGTTILWLMVNIWPIDLFGLAGLGLHYVDTPGSLIASVALSGAG